MTGYGRGENEHFRVEARSSNQRNLDLRINMPHYLFYLEQEIRKRIREKFQRGRIELFITRKDEGGISLKVNRALAGEYYRALLSLKEELSIPEDIGINVIAGQRDIFVLEEQETDVSGLYAALENALEDLGKMRMDEGMALADDIRGRLGLLADSLKEIEEIRKGYAEDSHRILTEKLRALFADIPIEEQRIIQEAAMIIERSDITEEIVRTRSHLGHAGEILTGGAVVGKKMDFLTQELNREINTIGAKAADKDITRKVITMKHEIEKIREQVQNLQ